MKTIILVLLLLSLVLAGCTTKAKARAQAQQAYTAAQAQAAQAARTQSPVITFVGPVRNPTIPWHEGITLAEAIDAAIYTGFSDPRMIRLIRADDHLDIAPNQLLRGTVNPTLEAGDVVEFRR
jgi:hypothetical protein